MSNADFYNNIKKQAATMEGSYPELSQHISGQQPGNKKITTEKPKGISIQMNRKDNKSTINPNMIMKKPSDNNPPSTTSTPSSKPTANTDNKNQSNNSSSKPHQQKQGLKIKLDPSLIKIRGKPSDNEINSQSVATNQPKSDNEKKSQPPQEAQFPPGFGNAQKDPPETKLPPGFENIQKGQQEIALPPGFENAKNQLPEADLKMPPGFSSSKNEEPKKEKSITVNLKEKEKTNTTISSEPIFKKTPSIVTEKKNSNQKKLLIGYKEDKSNENKNDDQIKNEGSNSTSHSIKSDMFASTFSKNKIVMNDKIIINDIKEAEQPKEMQHPPGFSQEPNTKPKFTINPAQIASRNSNPHAKEKNENKQHEEQDKQEAETQKQEQKEQPINPEKKEVKEQKEATAQQQKTEQKESQEQKEQQETLDQKEEEIPQQIQDQKEKEIPHISDQKAKEIPDTKEKDITQQIPDQKEQPEIIEQKEIPEDIQIPNQKEENEDKNKEVPQISDLKEVIQQTTEPKETLNNEREPTEEETQKSVDQTEIQAKPIHSGFPFDDDDFDGDFDELQYIANLRSEYDEEEEEEEEEEHERIVILPSQLVAQPLEIEKRTPISTNITFEKIDTANPFASYEEIESKFGSTASSSASTTEAEYVHFDSSQFPTSYGINDKIAYAFKQKGCRINVFDLNYGKLTSFQDNNLTSITAKGNVIVGSGNKELSFFKISKEALCSHNKIDLPNATSLVADPLDQTRFFFFTENDHSLYIVRYNEVKTKKDLISNDVLSFDLCSKYLIIVSSSSSSGGEIVRCRPRKEGSMFSLWERQIPTNNGFNSYITDDYYIEKVGQKVSIYEAETLKMIQNLSHVVHVFKGGGNPLFLLTNGIIVHFKNAYRFPRPVICAVANRENVVAWYSLDFAPYAKKTVNDVEKHSTFDKRKLKDMHSNIVNKTTNFIKEFSSKVNQKVKLFNVIDNALNNSEKAISKFNESINQLNSLVSNMTPKSSLIDSCFDFISKALFEEGLEKSLVLEKNDFLRFLSDERVKFVLQSIKSINNVANDNDNDNAYSGNKVLVNDELLFKLAAKIADVIDSDSVFLVEWLNAVLLALIDAKRKVAIESIAAKIQQIISKFSADVKDENTLSNLAMLNHIFSSSNAPSPSTV